VGIVRVEELRFGVEDVAECVRFFDDFGLERVEDGAAGATFRTPAGQRLHLRRVDDPELPAAVEPGSTLRELVWGVHDAADLDELGAAVGSDRDVVAGADGVLRARDVAGFAIGLTVADPVVPFSEPRREVNMTGEVHRWNEPLSNYHRARPIRVCHVALNVREQGWRDAVAFYTERLGFRVTDQLLDMGTFMQAPADLDQHTFLLAHRPNRVGLNHVAYEVRNVDEVIEGGNHMVACGWREARRLGRHTIGSNVFRFFHAPCGGRVEYAADMDRVDDSYGPNVYEQRPPHHLWMLRSHGDREGEGA
jgi:catechol 2,3-dioxygenase-like lactoylglutathione lyase family enzyme